MRILRRRCRSFVCEGQLYEGRNDSHLSQQQEELFATVARGEGLDVSSRPSVEESRRARDRRSGVHSNGTEAEFAEQEGAGGAARGD